MSLISTISRSSVPAAARILRMVRPMRPKPLSARVMGREVIVASMQRRPREPGRWVGNDLDRFAARCEALEASGGHVRRVGRRWTGRWLRPPGHEAGGPGIV